MPTVVGIRFKKACKIYYFDPAETGVAKGDFAIVETARGVEYGEVVIGPREVDDKQIVSPLKPVMRKATADDDMKLAENKIREKEAFNIFRELVKDLAAVFRTRIELRQIGVRDEAKMLGGIGSCGRPLCCATFLGDFEPVSIRMAKDQSLSLNPTKISGICGRLMCCLKYENHMYCKHGCNGCGRSERIEIPKMGSKVVTTMGEGKVVGINRKERTAAVQLSPDNTIQVEWEELVDASQADNV